MFHVLKLRIYEFCVCLFFCFVPQVSLSPDNPNIVVPALHVADVAKVLDAKKKAVVERIQREKQAAGLQSITDLHTFAQWKKQNLKAQVERAYVKFRSKKYKRKIKKLTTNN